MKVVALVGMAGAGKSEVARLFRESGFVPVRFGDVTDAELRRRGLEMNEASERLVREQLRREHGMAAYAKLNLPRIDAARQRSPVVVDGLYSWQEYLLLKDRYRADLTVVAVWSSPATRYARLGRRAARPLTPEEAAARDRAEIENLNKGGPIALADFTITNQSSREDLAAAVKGVIGQLR
ncbi:MAG: AAA family ATPase [Chloroflexota bacterium]